jgi:predicted membrane protein
MQKSNAPIILGVIGFILYIPGMFCLGACSAVVNAATEGASGNLGMPIVIAWLLCFVLSFFGKAKCSKATGIVMILASILLVLFALITLNLLFGLSSAICYLIAGIMSCLNASRGAVPSGATAHAPSAPLGQPQPAATVSSRVNPQQRTQWNEDIRSGGQTYDNEVRLDTASQFTVQKQKLIASLTLGTIGLILSLFTVLMTLMYMVKDGPTNIGPTELLLLCLVAIPGLLCFVLSFFGKAKWPKVMGIVLILASFFSVLFNPIAAACFLIAGIMSCLNASRGAVPPGVTATAHMPSAPLEHPQPAVNVSVDTDPQPGPQVPQQPLSGFPARATPSPVQTTSHKPSTGISLVEKPAPVNRPPNPQTKKPDGPGKVRWR